MEHTTDTATTNYIITALCTVISLLLVWTLSELKGIRKDMKDVTDRQNKGDLNCLSHRSETNQNTREVNKLIRLMIATRYDLARIFARVAIIDKGEREIEHVKEVD